MGGGASEKLISKKSHHPFPKSQNFPNHTLFSFFKTKSLVLSLTLAGVFFPLRMQAVTFDTGACPTDKNCGHLGFITDDDGSALHYTRVGLVKPYDHIKVKNASTVSPLQNFRGYITNLQMQGYSINAPVLLFKKDSSSLISYIEDSKITSLISGSLGQFDFQKSSVDGDVNITGGDTNALNFYSSSMKGDVNINGGTTNSVYFDNKYNTKSTPTLDGNIILNTGGTLDVKFTDAIWNGSFKDIGGNAASVINFTFTRSKINPTSNQITNFTFLHGTDNVTLNSSNLNVDVYTQATKTNITLNNNSSMNNINVMGGTNVKNITLNNGSYIHKLISTGGGGANLVLNNSTIGKLDDQDSIAMFSSGANIYVTATNNSTINGHFDSDAYNTSELKISDSIWNGRDVKISAIDSPLGKELTTKMAILNYYGTLLSSSYINNSTINGGILWIKSNFGSGEGLSFTKSTLNGSLYHNYSGVPANVGNDSIGASFNFNASTMNGDIIDGTSAITTTNGTANHALTNVTFRNKSTLN
ncbi:hypothetical protein, partial [Helicobacter sp. 13S00482-2]|uniref:hypothetical protein n=1 Tax=Helicobacter sp. 13S00482-2 TaxID=1476200 RepID=UPI00117AB3B3